MEEEDEEEEERIRKGDKKFRLPISIDTGKKNLIPQPNFFNTCTHETKVLVLILKETS